MPCNIIVHNSKSRAIFVKVDANWTVIAYSGIENDFILDFLQE